MNKKEIEKFLIYDKTLIKLARLYLSTFIKGSM